ncbi:MAG TPA: hypothetical protein VG826_00755 [Pirellulales bacterium]|nr:hypothetical protein [Pirellulales bacterium]
MPPQHDTCWGAFRQTEGPIAVPQFQFKLRSLFWLMTAVAMACVIVPASPLVASHFRADSRDWLVAVALGIFVALAASKKRTGRRAEAE